MQFVKIPNLPQKRVKAVLISETVGADNLKTIEKLGIEPIVVHSCYDIAPAVSSHPDMLFHHLGGNKIVYYKNADKTVIKRLTELCFEMIASKAHLKQNYPYDIALNSARVDNYLFCLEGYTDKEILNYCAKSSVHIINVKQGYTKCSTCVVDEASIITSDIGIAKRADECGVAALLINHGFIKLKGYDEGFIGGCCGKIDKNKILFIGNLKNHKNCVEIKEFLKERKIEIEVISDSNLCDVGSIIPLLEE